MVTNIHSFTQNYSIYFLSSILAQGERVGMSSVVSENWVHCTKTVV